MRVYNQGPALFSAQCQPQARVAGYSLNLDQGGDGDGSCEGLD